ncbi:MAG: hypothetical protein QXD64_07070 [Thermoplasmata archaeon]
MEEAKKWKSDAALINIRGYPDADGMAPFWTYTYTALSCAVREGNDTWYRAYRITIYSSGKVNEDFATVPEFLPLQNWSNILDSDVIMKVVQKERRYQEFFSNSSGGDNEISKYVQLQISKINDTFYWPIWYVYFQVLIGVYPADYMNWARFQLNGTSGEVIEAETHIEGHAYRWFQPPSPCFVCFFFPLILVFLFVVLPLTVWKLRKK